MSASATATRAVFRGAEPQAAQKVGIAGCDRLTLWMLTAFAFVLPTELRLPDGKSVAMRLGYACLLLGIVALVKRGAFVLPPVGFWLSLGFVAWSSCTLMWARYPELAGQKILLYFAVFAVTAIIPQHAWSPQVRTRLMDSYLVGCWLGILGTIYNFVFGEPYPDLGYMDAESRFSIGNDPNYLALSLVIGIPFALYRSEQFSVAWERALALLYVPAVLVAVLLTGSRGGLAAFLVAVAISALLKGLRMPGLVFAGAGLCLTLSAMLPGQIIERFTDIPGELRYGTLSGRRQLWDRSAAIIAEHPVEGIGAGATTGALDLVAHNSPLELMVEGGLVSAGLFYGALLLGIRAALRRDRKEGRAFVAAWSVWFVGTLSLSWEVQPVTWFMFALLFSASAARAPEGDVHALAESARRVTTLTTREARV